MCFVFSKISFSRIESLNTKSLTDSFRSEKLIFNILFILSLFYFLLEMPQIIKSISSIIALDFYTLREDHWNQAASESNPISSIGRSASFIIAINSYYFFRHKQKFKLVVALIAFSFIAFETLSRGGRGNLFYVLSCILWSFFLFMWLDGKTFLRSLPKKSYAILGIIFFIGAVIFPLTRNEAYTDNFNKYLAFRHDVQIAEWIIESNYSENLSLLAFSSQYFTQPIAKLSDHIENLDVDNYYHMGQFNFRFLNFQDVRNKLEEKISSQGYRATNPWGTGARDIIIDFGYVGGVVFLFILSCILKLGCDLWVKQQTMLRTSLAVICIMFAFMFYFTSALRITLLMNSLILAFVLLIFDKFKFKIK